MDYQIKKVPVDDLNLDWKNPRLAEFGISDKTSQNWRQNNVIQYSLIGGKVFYRISDIIELFEKNLRKSTKL